MTMTMTRHPQPGSRPPPPLSLLLNRTFFSLELFHVRPGMNLFIVEAKHFPGWLPMSYQQCQSVECR